MTRLHQTHAVSQRPPSSSMQSTSRRQSSSRTQSSDQLPILRIRPTKLPTVPTLSWYEWLWEYFTHSRLYIAKTEILALSQQAHDLLAKSFSAEAVEMRSVLCAFSQVGRKVKKWERNIQRNEVLKVALKANARLAAMADTWNRICETLDNEKRRRLTLSATLASRCDEVYRRVNGGHPYWGLSSASCAILDGTHITVTNHDFMTRESMKGLYGVVC